MSDGTTRESANPDEEKALATLNAIQNVNAHTDGGGVKNDLTAELKGVARLPPETTQALRDWGYSTRTVHSTATTPEVAADVVITFHHG